MLYVGWHDAIDDETKDDGTITLTGEESEWIYNNCIKGEFKNKRLNSVFKDASDNIAYYNTAIIFRYENGSTFTGCVYIDESLTELIHSHQPIKFPFTPKKFYIDVKCIEMTMTIEEAYEKNKSYSKSIDWKCFHTVLKDKEQLKEVFEYYVQK